MCVWLWNSPTFTTWGNYGAQSLRLLLVTPLILTRFDETEIAAWYLFASLNFFGTTISMRLGVTFSRMFAYAMGGASILAPIKGKRAQENEGKPDWTVFERAYGTVGSLNFGIGWLNVLVALGMGWFGLTNLIQGYEAKGVIWLGFAMMQASSLLCFIFQRYEIALQGMNYVALSNRWGIIFSLLSIAAGSLTLWLGGGFIALILIMQSFAVAGVFLNRFLLQYVEDGRVLQFRQNSFDREVFGWAWEPTWRGMILYVADLGTVQIGMILFASVGSVSEVASYLFTVQILRSIVGPCNAPLYSCMPLLGRLLASGDSVQLRGMYFKRIYISQFLLSSVLIGLFIFGNELLVIIGASVELLPREYLLLMLGGVLHQWFINYTGSITTLGNYIVMIPRVVFSFVVSLVLFYFLLIEYSIFGVIFATWIPRVFILNVGYGVYASEVLNCNRIYYLMRLYLGTIISSVILLLCYIFIY